MKLNHPVFIFTFHLLIVAALMAWSLNAPIGDWGNYYYGAHGYVDGNKFLIYDVTQFNSYVDSWHEQHYFLSYTQVPPLSLLIYFPFTFLKAGLAKLVFTGITYLFGVVSIMQLFKKMKIDLRWSLLLPLLFFLPLRSNIDAGQSYFLLVALLAAGWLLRENGKWMFSALCFALAIHLKIFPAIVLIWFLAEKDWKMFGATICAVGLFFAVSLAFIDWGIWENYFVEVLPRLAKGEINNTYASAFQSMQVLLKQVFVPDALHNPSAPVDSVFLYRLGIIIWSGIVLVTAFLFSLDKKQTSFFRFSIWIFAGILISGYGSTYGLLLFIFPVLAIINHASLSRNKKIALLFLIALIANIPGSWLPHFPFPLSFLRLILMLCFFAGLIYWFRPQWNKFAMLALIIPCLALANENSNAEEGSRYFLKKEPSMLITGFNINGDTINYTFRDGEGLHEAHELFPEHIEQAEMKYGSPHYVLWENADYHFPGERISNLFVINKKYFLYLSDKNRGVGFNTIRIKEIDPDEYEKQVKSFFQK